MCVLFIEDEVKVWWNQHSTWKDSSLDFGTHLVTDLSVCHAGVNFLGRLN